MLLATGDYVMRTQHMCASGRLEFKVRAEKYQMELEHVFPKLHAEDFVECKLYEDAL